jgi:DNA repair exonuclease SbcCD ATPase subunit
MTSLQMRDKIKSHKSTFYQGMKEKDAIIADNNKNIKKIDVKLEEIVEGQKQYAVYDEETLNLSLEDILEAEKQERDFASNLAANKKEIDALEDRLDDIEDDIENPSSVKICPRCGSESCKEHDVDALLEEKEVVQTELLKYNKVVDNLRAGRRKDPLPISSREFSKIQGYKDLCRDETNYEEMKQEFLSSISDAQTIKDTHKTWYDVMRFWEKAFSEQGVIKYIINNVLDYFNERCNYYLSYLTNSKYSVEFDEELVEKIETNGRLLSYISLSGGEKRKLNLAVLLGLKDLLLFTDKSHVDCFSLMKLLRTLMKKVSKVYISCSC